MLEPLTYVVIWDVKGKVFKNLALQVSEQLDLHGACVKLNQDIDFPLISVSFLLQSFRNVSWIASVFILSEGQANAFLNFHAPPEIQPIEMKWKNALAELRMEIELCTGEPVSGLESQREKDPEVVLQKIREEVKSFKKHWDDKGVGEYKETTTKQDELQGARAASRSC